MIAESVKLRKRKCSEKSGSEKPVSKKPGSEKSVSEKLGSEKPGSEKSGSMKPGFENPGSEKSFKSNLKRHISMVDEKTKPLSCPNCLRMFSDKRGFGPHLKKCSLSMVDGEI
jgi:hypothetical protein